LGLRKITCTDLAEVGESLISFTNHWGRWVSMLKESGVNLKEIFSSIIRDLGEVPLYGGCIAEFTARYGMPAIAMTCGDKTWTETLNTASDLGTIFLMGVMRLPVIYSAYTPAVYPYMASAKFVGDFREDKFEGGELRINLCDERYTSIVSLSGWSGDLLVYLYGNMWRVYAQVHRYYSSPNVDLGFLKPLVMKDFGEILGTAVAPLLKLKNWERYLSEDNEIVMRIVSFLSVL